MALLLSIWIVTSGGPKLAIRHDKIDPFHTSQILDREYDNDFFFNIYILSILVKKKLCNFTGIEASYRTKTISL